MKYLQVLAVLCYGFILDASSVQPKKETQALIREGNLVTYREFPFIAEITTFDGNGDIYSLCAGTLVSSTWILTAASCVKNGSNDYSLFDVRVGGNVRWSSRGKGMTFVTFSRIAFAVVHQNYTPTDGAAYDIAMLKLVYAIPFTSSTKPANLTSSPRIDSFGIMVGWGKSYTLRKKEESRDLLKLTVNLYDSDDCNNLLGTQIRSGQFCAISPSGTTACARDGGGPMVSKSEVIGVLSRGNDNCTITPSIYVRVYPLKKWITGVLNNETYGGKDAPGTGPYRVFEQ